MEKISTEPDPTARTILTTAAAAGFLGVALGAFGAHGLQPLLEQRGTASAWQTGIQYWFYHTLALLALGFAGGLADSLRRRISIAWVAGMLIFSGSLFFLATTGPRWLGAITPIGGTLFLLGWVFLLLGIRRKS